MIVLGIETSCDETAASVVKYDKNGVVVLSNIVSSQIEIHKKYNGVVPEVAAREHVLNMVPVVNEALAAAGINTPHKTTPNPSLERRGIKIDAIAVAAGPGLITSLLAGVETAKTLAFVWKKPLIAVNHIEGHIAANFITSPRPSPCKGEGASVPSPLQGEGQDEVKNIKFPAIILTVSGGHTMIVLAKKIGDYKIIGDTRDDAAGEAFDKAAKLMELGYPGGPVVSKCAEEFITSPNPLPAKRDKERELKPPSPLQGEGRDEVKNKIEKINLPRPMIDSPDFDFSFSGLKTALLYQLKKDDKWRERVPEYCHEFQNAVVETLIKKTIKAARKYQAKTIMLAGGVSANKCLREKFVAEADKENLFYRIPEFKYTTDNAAMIAAAGCFKAKAKKFTPWKKIKANCNLKIKN